MRILALDRDALVATVRQAIESDSGDLSTQEAGACALNDLVDKLDLEAARDVNLYY